MTKINYASERRWFQFNILCAVRPRPVDKEGIFCYNHVCQEQEMLFSYLVKQRNYNYTFFNLSFMENMRTKHLPYQRLLVKRYIFLLIVLKSIISKYPRLRIRTGFFDRIGFSSSQTKDWHGFESFPDFILNLPSPIVMVIVATVVTLLSRSCAFSSLRRASGSIWSYVAVN